MKHLFSPSTSWVLTILLAVLTLLAYIFFLPPEIPIFYSLIQPQDQLASKLFIFLFPVVAAVITFLQSLLLRLSKQEELIETILSFGSFCVIIFLYIAFFRIWMILR